MAPMAAPNRDIFLSSVCDAEGRVVRLVSSTAATKFSRCQRPTSASLYLPCMTSPCSVRRIWPLTVPGGCARMASKLEPPPRATEPPRPWNKRSLALFFLKTCTSSRSAQYKAQLEVRSEEHTSELQ